MIYTVCLNVIQYMYYVFYEHIYFQHNNLYMKYNDTQHLHRLNYMTYEIHIILIYAYLGINRTSIFLSTGIFENDCFLPFRCDTVDG